MRRLLLIAAIIVVASSFTCAEERQSDSRDADQFRLNGATPLKWPDKKVVLDVKDASVTQLAETLGKQTGIKFIVADGVPKDLKITINVSGMAIKQFLDTLTTTTNLVYIAESRTPSGEPAKPKVEEAHESFRNEYRSITVTTWPSVTHVTISSFAAEGVFVNAGRVSLSLKDADPIDAVTKLLKQMNIGYMIMGLDDFLKLQDSDRAAEIKKAVQKVGRPKIDLVLRNTDLEDALALLADKGMFYITVPSHRKPGYIIIPDVKITDAGILPIMGDDYALSTAHRMKAQEMCTAYVKQMADAVLKWAKEHDGVLPNGGTWITDIPVKNEQMAARNPRYQYAYALNANLSMKKLSDIADPAKTVLIFETDHSICQGVERNIAAQLRHPDGNTYAFADGHIEVRKDVPNFQP